MSAYIYSGGTIREAWDDATRTFTEHNAQGQQTSTRPYTAGENAAADAALTSEQARAEAVALAEAQEATGPRDPCSRTRSRHRRDVGPADRSA